MRSSAVVQVTLRTSTTSSSGLLLNAEFLFPLAQNSPTALHSLNPSHALHTEQLFLAYRSLEALWRRWPSGREVEGGQMFLAFPSLCVAELVPEYSCTTDFTPFLS
jgi:hypothetical protein